MIAGAGWQNEFKRPATLWQWMDPKKFDEEQGDRPIYPHHIDMVTVYSLLHDYVTTYKKPIVMHTGNHEAYEKPYGVSPCVGQFLGLKPEGVERANAGIPSDHNLTTYEAALLYGPAYNDYRQSHNFQAQYLEWFYMLFTPLSDFTLTYGKGEEIAQSFTALEWEDEEQYVENKFRGGGTLPRATRAISKEQLELLRAARTRGQDRVLLTHFTFVSYGIAHRITAAGEVNINDDLPLTHAASTIPLVGPLIILPVSATARTAANWGQIAARMSEYEEGTFIRNRKAVYDMLYAGAFTHVFSGHSHRAGFYVMTNKTRRGLRDQVQVQGYAITEAGQTTAQHLKGGKARLIVGASGGPIPVQNHTKPRSKEEACATGAWNGPPVTSWTSHVIS